MSEFAMWAGIVLSVAALIYAYYLTQRSLMRRRPRRDAIVDYLTDEQKQRILARERAMVPGTPGHVRARDEPNCCPLGAAIGMLCPLASTVTRRLVDDHQAPQWRSVYEAAREFISDNDGGRIRPEQIHAIFAAGRDLSEGRQAS